MQFDLSRFLGAMLAAFLDCQDDDSAEITPRITMDRQPVAVRFAAGMELMRQARKQGANRRDQRKFMALHINEAMDALSREIDSRCKD